METESNQYITDEGSFMRVVQQARLGNKDALQQLLQFYDDDISQFAKYIKMPREDAIQSIRVEFIELILSGKLNR